MVLNKRHIRNIKKNLFRYLALLLLIACGMYLAISIIASSEAIIVGVEKAGIQSNVEDGQFITLSLLEDSVIDEIEREGILLQEGFYLDYEILDEDVIRIYKLRDDINKQVIDSGNKITGKNQMIIEKHFFSQHGLEIGNSMKIGGVNVEIIGTCTFPDYDAVLRSFSDAGFDTESFSVAVVDAATYDDIRDSGLALAAETKQYSFVLDDNQNADIVKDILDKNEVDTVSFVEREDNPRIAASSDKVATGMMSGITIGILLVILFAYIISVFVVHSIDEERRIIGTFYAMGIKEKELLRHYLFLPVAVTFIAGLAGFAAGISKMGIGLQLSRNLSHYSVPELPYYCPLYLYLYGICLPPLVAWFVGYIVIKKKLHTMPLELLKKGEQYLPAKKIAVKSKNFIRVFRMKQLIREIWANVAVFVGVFLTILLLMVGLDIHVMIGNFSQQVSEEIRFSNMYILNFPLNEEFDATKGVQKSLQADNRKYSYLVNIIGLEENDFFKSAGTPEMIGISSSLANKFGLKTGDSLVLYEDDIEHSFVIDYIEPYAAGFYVFADIDYIRSYFEYDYEYYNVLLSSEELDIGTEYIYTVITKNDLIKYADVFIDMLQPMVIAMILISAIILIAVLYLMIKLMIDKSTLQISMFKIFGYRNSEVRKLYIDFNIITVVISAIFSLPVSKIIADMIMPYFVLNIAIGFDLSFNNLYYVIIVTGIILLYFLVTFFVLRKIYAITPSEVLKDRE